jgi:hypothetical protein
MLQHKVEQLGHGGLFFRLVDVFVVALGAEQSLALTSRGVVAKDRTQHVGARIWLVRGLALQHQQRDSERRVTVATSSTAF